VTSLLRFLRTRGLQRGVFGSSRGWLAVWVAITLGRQINRRLGKEPELVDRVVLRPGQSVQIVDTGVKWKDDPVAASEKGRERRLRRGRKR